MGLGWGGVWGEASRRRVLVSELSGKSNIAALTSTHGVVDSEVTKAVLAEVQRREALGYQYEAADASFALVVSKAMRNFTPHFKRIRYQVEVSGYGSIRHGSNTYARSAVEPSRSLLGAF